MKQKNRILFKEISLTFAKKVLVYDLILILLVLLSFLFYKGFSPNALSERLFWVGLATMVLGGLLSLGQTTGGRDFGTPVITTAQARLLTDFNIEIRQDIERKFGPFVRIFLVGTVILLLSILIQVIFG